VEFFELLGHAGVEGKTILTWTEIREVWSSECTSYYRLRSKSLRCGVLWTSRSEWLSTIQHSVSPRKTHNFEYHRNRLWLFIVHSAHYAMLITLVTPRNTQFYNPYILSITWLLHVLALSPSLGNLRHDFIKEHNNSDLYIVYVLINT